MLKTMLGPALVLLFTFTACRQEEGAAPITGDDGLPAPADLHAVYEPRSRAVHLHWPAVVKDGLKGYIVYRSTEAEPEPQPAHAGLLQDTLFREFLDSLGVEGPASLTYLVKAMDSGFRMSGYSPSVTLSDSILHLASVVSLEVRGGRVDSQGLTPWRGLRIAGLGQPLTLVARFEHPARRHRAFAWRQDGRDEALQEGSLDAPSGERTVEMSFSEKGRKLISFSVTDEFGWTWGDRVEIQVDEDYPRPRISAPAAAFLGDTLRISAAGSSDFLGRVVGQEWRFGTEAAWVSGGLDTLLPTAGRPLGDLAIYVRVTDDHGLQSEDSVVVHVTTRRGKTFVRAGQAPLAESGYNAGLPAVDFQGKIRMLARWRSDTGNIWGMGATADGARWEITPMPETWYPRKNYGFVAHDGRLWLFGGEPLSGGHEGYGDVWWSSDGTIWVQASGHADFGPRSSSYKTVFKGRLWSLGGHVQTAPRGTPTGVDEIWSSLDGVGWVLEGKVPWGYNAPDALVLPFGGHLLEIRGSSIRASLDGKTWEQRAQSSLPNLNGRGVAAEGGLLWLIAGGTSSLSPRGAYHYDANPSPPQVWVSVDGRSFVQASDDAGFGPLAHATTVAFGGKVWVIGGWKYTREPLSFDSVGPTYWARPSYEVWVSD